MQLGEFEEIVLLAVGVLHGNAYGVSVKTEIDARLRREVAVGALQVTLRRLEKKGFLTSKHGDSDPARGGRPKLYFTLTAYGKNALDRSRKIRDELWQSLPEHVLKLG